MGVLKGCTPRKEVLKGDLNDAIFAADFGDLIAGKSPKVYGDATIFFQNTHPAKALCRVIRAIYERLANTKEGGATIRLSTGFGGGKTHTLMALWHLGHNIENSSMGADLLPAAGRPKKVAVVAIDAGKAGVPDFASHGNLKVHSLWGEMFYKLGGEKALKTLGKADDPESSPNEAQIEAVFPSGPVLILLDELVVYMAKLSERGQGNLLGILNTLAAIAGKRKQTVLVVTDPADQRVYAKEAYKIGDSLTSAAVKLDDLFGRKMTDFDPIGDESARVIVRRLFESVDSAAAQAASAVYHSLYDRIVRDYPGQIPPNAASADYAKRIVDCYPFHPRLLDTAQDRLGAMQMFHKSRGTLRLFARILRTIWESKQDIELIANGDIEWSSDRIQADLLQRLSLDNFKAAVSADIEKHASELDGGNKRGIHVRVASALLLESLPMQSNSGLDPADLTLAVLRPEEAGPEPAEALDRLVGVCWHTYPMAGGRGWQFRYEPNIIKQIEKRMPQIPIEDAKSRVLSEVQGYFSGPAFKLTAWPTSSRQVSESADLQLVLCEEEKTAKAVCSYADNADPAATIPRRFINAILAVTASGPAFDNAIERAQRLLAAEAIERDHRTGESNKLVREQLKKIMPELQKQFRLQTCRAFDRIVFAGGSSYQVEEQFQVPDEQILQKAQGQSCLKKFLDSKTLIYQPGDALDVGRFLKDVLPGATPTVDKHEVYTGKAVHERFLGTQGLRLIPDGGIIRQTILKAVADGKIVVRLADGRTYDAKGCVEGPEGKRRRIPGVLTSLTLDDTVYITKVGFTYGILWTREDHVIKEQPDGPVETDRPPRPPGMDRVEASGWEKILEYSPDRPLLKIDLVAASPADAATFAKLAQPLGADSIGLSLTVSGTSKDGGSINFAVSDLKLNDPIKPIQIAQTLFNALGSDSTYEADLSLVFGPTGRLCMEDPLRMLSDEAPDGITPTAIFGKQVGGKR
ncbi:MAG: DUF499 domain-containing protein [Pseudomonadota bacterium]